MKTLISIISEQTLPNLLFAKEKGKFDRYIFIYTQKMTEKLATLRQVLDIVIINDNEKEVLEDSLENIQQKLQEFTFEDDEEIIVNLTGGTKVMAIGVYNFFVKKPCKMYYIAFLKNEIVQIFPEVKQKTQNLAYRTFLLEYLQTYNVQIETQNFEQKNKIFLTTFTQNIFAKNTQRNNNEKRKFWDFWKPLKDFSIDETLKRQGFLDLTLPQFIPILQGLEALNYTTNTENKLSETEVKYFAGMWWEEYLYHFIKTKLNLSDNEIGLNIEINKDSDKKFSAGNEFDILFVYNNRLYVIECKTGITDLKKSGMKVFNEYTYKLSALRKFFGLGVKTILCILQTLPQNAENQNFYKERTELLNISLFDGKSLMNMDNFLNELIK